MIAPQTSVLPFLRWAGGKRWLAAHLSPILRTLLDESTGIYYEPFLGAGSMYFGLAPQKSILSDLNTELIATYVTIRDSWADVESVMRGWRVTKENYYKIRSLCPDDQIVKAARFVWLNRTCYGGLYRVNKSNLFNVPYGGGRTPEVLYANKVLQKCSDALKGGIYQNRSVILEDCDFEVAINKSKEGDVVYCDPTYSCVARDQFDRYGPNVFDWNDQKRLAKSAQEASERGAIVIVSNAYAQDLAQIFACNYMIRLTKKKAIGNCTAKLERHMEYLFILDPYKRRKVWEKLTEKMKCDELLVHRQKNDHLSDRYCEDCIPNCP